MPQQDNWLPEDEGHDQQWGLCSVHEIYLYAWFFFMQHGLIPWWVQEEGAALEENVMAAVRQHAPLCRRKWAQAWAGGRLNVVRWIQQCSATLRRSVLHAVFGEAAGNAAMGGEQRLLQPLSAQAAPGQLQCVYWDALFTSLMAGGGPPRHGMVAFAAAQADPGLDEPLRVKQAGLVLLQAHLEQLFAGLGWLQPSAASLLPGFRARALHLLAFMAGADPQTPEYNLALHKILCGVPLDAPVEKEVQLTEEERQAALLALAAAARQWEVTGTDGCRAWLQMEGKLQCSFGEWCLLVNTSPPVFRETAAVRLPWMLQPLAVQWTIS